jgi:hypothetical protein
MNILLGEFSAELSRKGIFKAMNWNRSVYKSVIIIEIE